MTSHPKSNTEEARGGSPARKGSVIPGMSEALCALSFFRGRHRWKERGSRNGMLVKNRIKDLSQSSRQRDACRAFIAKARALNFRGSILDRVMGPN